jgi:hypothetical protein
MPFFRFDFVLFCLVSFFFSLKANGATAGLRSCLDLYDGLVPALEWTAGSVAVGRYDGA